MLISAQPRIMTLDPECGFHAEDVMDFWREDNAVAFHTAQYLAGQYFPDARFIASSRYGHQQQQLGKARLEGINA